MSVLNLDLVSSLLDSVDNVSQETVEQEFNVLRTQSSSWKKSQRSETGALKENIRKNRYKDILPYDQSRVVLSLRTSESDGDYINASFIQGPLSDRCIAAQAPLSSTVTDFWRMIWENQVQVIVMACREFEMGRKKCESYWSPLNQTSSFGPFSVLCQGESSPTADIVVRKLQVSFRQEYRAVTQLQFLSWPDHDVPHEASGVLDLLHRVQDLLKSSPGPVQRVQDFQNHKSCPKLVHCSAGCGRTGVVCALDQIYHLLLHQRLTPDFSIMRLVMDLRRQRPSSVQTKDQYQFIYTATSFLFRWFLQKNRSAQIYSNLPQLKTSQTRPRVTAENHRSQQENMEATYATVNKNKSSQSETSYAQVATPRSTHLIRTTDATHHYDNDLSQTPAAPVYSVVRPRAKPHPPEAHLYDLATPTSPDITPPYHLLSASEADDDYEDVSAPASDSSFAPSNGIGFNSRIQKPRGPRDPPAEWGRLER